MKTEQQREALKGAYSGEKWQQKVADMTASQVHAIFIRLRQQGKV
jgi:hypothetical protein